MVLIIDISLVNGKLCTCYVIRSYKPAKGPIKLANRALLAGLSASINVLEHPEVYLPAFTVCALNGVTCPSLSVGIQTNLVESHYCVSVTCKMYVPSCMCSYATTMYMYFICVNCSVIVVPSSTSASPLQKQDRASGEPVIDTTTSYLAVAVVAATSTLWQICKML